MNECNLYRITEFNDEKPVVLIILYYLRSIYLYLGNPPFSNPHNGRDGGVPVELC